MTANIFYALLLTLLAGLATAIGGLISLILGKAGTKHLSIILGFSAGVMIYVSFVELLPLAIDQAGKLTATIAFFLGIVFLAILDIFIPHEYKGERVEDSHPSLAQQHRAVSGGGENTISSIWRRRRGHHRGRNFSPLMRTGLLVAMGIAIHNIPEGLAVFSSALAGNITLGISVAIAVALHNIPEGICIFTPIYEGTNNARRAFLATLFAGLAEPLGALIGFAVLYPFMSPTILSGLLAFAAGVMVYISLDELLPAAHEYGEAHLIIIGVGVGMAIMAVSFILIK